MTVMMTINMILLFILSVTWGIKYPFFCLLKLRGWWFIKVRICWQTLFHPVHFVQLYIDKDDIDDANDEVFQPHQDDVVVQLQEEL